jgi:heme/copper-type cytochrome/quinol oxidase subunit 4
MIQRQQSLWLLLSTVCSFLSFKFPFYSGNLKDGTFAELEGGSTFFLLIFTGISLLLSLITIFLYKDRKLQLKLALGGAVLSVLILIIYFMEMRSYAKGNVAFTCIFALAIIAGYIMATRGIWKDEKLVKSLDKLR